jgi:hypothetical protein
VTDSCVAAPTLKEIMRSSPFPLILWLVLPMLASFHLRGKVTNQQRRGDFGRAID